MHLECMVQNGNSRSSDFTEDIIKKIAKGSGVYQFLRQVQINCIFSDNVRILSVYHLILEGCHYI